MICPKTGRDFHMNLIDDGTLDTVFKCSSCNEVMRFVDGELDFSSDSERLQYFKDAAEEDHENDLILGVE